MAVSIVAILNGQPRREEEKVKGQFEVDFGLFCRIYAVKGKEISIFLQI
jgi:hypothetical protein